MNSSHGSPTVLCQKKSARFWAIHSCACFSISQREGKWKSPNLKLMTKHYTRKDVCEKTLTISKTPRRCLGEDGLWKEGCDGSLFWGLLTPGCHNSLHPSNMDQDILVQSVFRDLFFPLLLFFISTAIVVLLNLPLLVDCLWLFVHIQCVGVVSSFLLKINMTGALTSLEKHGPTGAPIELQTLKCHVYFYIIMLFPQR